MQSENANQNRFDELLIENVKNFPVLYETSAPGNKNKKIKDNAWKLIASELKSNGKF